MPPFAAITVSPFASRERFDAEGEGRNAEGSEDIAAELEGRHGRQGDLALARRDGRYDRLFRVLAGVRLLILDDWGLEPLNAEARHNLLEILEKRHGRRSTVVTSQVPVDKWHEVIGNPTYADAILGRLVHNAQRIELNGHSLRRQRVTNATTTQPKS